MKRNKDNKIAVLLSAYNGEKYIECQINSIINQKLTDFDLVLFVRDDGSKDLTKDILIKYDEEYPQVNIIFGENKGYIASFFELIYYIKKCEEVYDYIALSDQDDQWDSDKLQVAIDKITENQKNDNESILYQATTRVVDDNLNFICIDAGQKRCISFFNTIIQTFAPGHTYVFNNALLENINDNLDCSRLYGHDAYLTNLAIVKGKIIFDNEPHNNYRQHLNNQLGTSGYGVKAWIDNKLRRVKNGDGKKYSQQMKYFMELFNEDLDSIQKEEIKSFFSCQTSLLLRCKYAMRTKLYRQGKLETFAFKLLYIVGGYNE